MERYYLNFKNTNYKKIITYLLITIIALTPILYFPYINKADLYPLRNNKYQIIGYDNIYKPKIYTIYYLILLLSIVILLKQIFRKWDLITVINNNSIFMFLLLFIVFLLILIFRIMDLSTDINNISIFMFLFFTFLSTYFSKYYYRSLYGRPFRWEGLITYISYVIIFITTGYFITKTKYL